MNTAAADSTSDTVASWVQLMQGKTHFAPTRPVSNAQTLSEALKQNTTLRKLDLSEKQIDASGAKALAEALKVNTTLERLNLDSNDIGFEGAQAMADALRENSTLQRLSLYNNDIDYRGSQAVAHALKANSALQELNLFMNPIGSEGARALSQALQVNSTLQVLNLDCCQIGSEGAESLGKALKVNTSLQRLNMDCNNVENAGARSLAEALEVNTTLQNLDLYKNKINQEGATSLLKAMEKNSTLLGLELSENRISSDLIQHLKKIVNRNAALSKFVEANCLSVDQERVVYNEMHENNFLSMMTDDDSVLTIASYILRKHTEGNSSCRDEEDPTVETVHHPLLQNGGALEMLFQSLLSKKQDISISLREFGSHCDQWTSLKVQKAHPSSHETFESVFPSLSSSLLSHINVSTVDDKILNGLREVASLGPVAQELLHYLPIMKELQEWKDHHDECNTLTSQVKNLQQTLEDVEEELEISELNLKRSVRKQKLSMQQRKKAEEQIESLRKEISTLRESVEESLLNLAYYPVEVHENYLREAEAALIPNTDTSEDDPISHVEKKLIYCGKLLRRDYNRDYSDMVALDRTNTVMKAHSNRKNNEEVILKRLPFNTSPQQSMAWNELNHLLTLQSRPYVIELNGAFIQETPYGHDLILEMPYCPNGNLMHWLKKEEYDSSLIYNARAIRQMDTKRSCHEILLMFLQISEAVGEIHSLGIEHRDLKPENILIEGTGSLARVKLIDFGIGKDSNISFSTTMKTASGVNIQMTTRYAPPERKHSSPHTNNDDSIREGSWDMYSLGVILYEMLCAPKDGGRIDTLSETNCDASQILSSQSGHVDEWSCNLVKSLLSKTAGERPSASELCSMVKQKIFDTHSEMQGRIERRRRSARHQLLQSMQSSLDDRSIHRFTVNRSNLISDTLAYFMTLDSRAKILHNHMTQYERESGVGSGVFRDLCTQITNQLQENARGELLESDAWNGWEFYSPVDSNDVGRKMEALGRLVFYCVARNYTLRLRLSPLVYCSLVDQVPTTASGWLDILRAHDSSVSHIEKYLHSSNSLDREMAIAQVEAKKKALMGRENRMNNIQSFCRGFTSCMTAAEKEKLSNLSWRDAQFLCSGNEVISPSTVLQVMEDSLSGSRWSEPSAHRQTASWFKEWIKKQDSDGLRVFLGFVTGLNSLPVNLRGYKIKVIPCNSYVSAATCFKEIRIGIGCENREGFFSMMDQVMENYDIDGQRRLED